MKVTTSTARRCVTVRLLKPWMARLVGSLVVVGTVEADLLIERGAAEAVPTEEGGESGEPKGPPSAPPQTTTKVTAPPQNKAVTGPLPVSRERESVTAPQCGVPKRGRLAPPPRRK